MKHFAFSSTQNLNSQSSSKIRMNAFLFHFVSLIPDANMDEVESIFSHKIIQIKYNSLEVARWPNVFDRSSSTSASAVMHSTVNSVNVWCSTQNLFKRNMKAYFGVSWKLVLSKNSFEPKHQRNGKSLWCEFFVNKIAIISQAKNRKRQYLICRQMNSPYCRLYRRLALISIRIAIIFFLFSSAICSRSHCERVRRNDFALDSVVNRIWI